MDRFNSITTGITGRCNAKCKFCSHTQNIRFDKGTLDLDLDIILKPILSLTNQIIMNGGLGEPTLHPNLLSFVSMCRKEFPDLIINISTNGDTKDDNFWRELGSISEDKIVITFGIDGTKESNYKHRGTNFDRIINNLKCYIDNGGNAIWQFIVFDFNYDEIEYCLELAGNLGCKEFFAIRSDIYDEEFKPPNTMISRNDLMLTLQKKNIDSEKDINCYWKKRNSIYISEYGEVHPCCHILPYLNAFEFNDIRHLYLKYKDDINLYKNDIETVLNSPYLNYIYNNHHLIYRCRITCAIGERLMPLLKRIVERKFIE